MCTSEPTTPVAACGGTSDSKSGSSAKRKHRSEGNEFSPNVCYTCTICGNEYNSIPAWAKHLDHPEHAACLEQGAQCTFHDPAAVEAAEQIASTGRVSYEEEMKLLLLKQYSALRYQNMVPATTVDSIKSDLMEPALAMIKDELLKRLAQPDSSWGVENVVNEVFDVHLGIGSAHLERKTMEAVIKPVHAARRELIDQPNEEGKATGPRKGVCVCVCLCTCR